MVKVHVLYCGGWGYKTKVDALEERLKQDFSDLQLESESTPQITGYLEVTVDNKLVHSKKNGDGYVDSDEKIQKIIDAITEASSK